MKLIISEKPSVAMSIAAALGIKGRRDGYLEGNGYYVSWCVGHLVALAEPDAYNPALAKWRKDTLPILPDRWKYRIAESTRKQFDILKSLMDMEYVDTIVNACASHNGYGSLFPHCNRRQENVWQLESIPSLLGFSK